MCVYVPIKAILHQPRTLPLARYVILSWVEPFLYDVPINKAEYQVSAKHTKFFCFFLYGSISTQLRYPVVMSILWQFVQNIECDLSTWISGMNCANFWWCPGWDHLQKCKTPRYLSVMTVTGSRVCASSTVSFSRGVQRAFKEGNPLPRTGFQLQQNIWFFHRSSVSRANSSGHVYLTPAHDAACSFVSSGAFCAVSGMYLVDWDRLWFTSRPQTLSAAVLDRTRRTLNRFGPGGI